MPLPPATVPLARKLLQWTGVRLEVPACHEWANYCAFSFIQKATMVYVNTCAHMVFWALSCTVTFMAVKFLERFVVGLLLQA